MQKVELILSLILLPAISLGVTLTRSRFTARSTKVAGGEDTAYGEFPYQLSLQDGSFGFFYHICGAIIYNENYALTAAHCVKDADVDDPYYLKVVAGDYSLYTVDGNEQSSILSQIIIHEDFNQYTRSHDVALLKLATPLTFNDFVQQINLPSQGQASSGSCTLTGWGDTSDNGDPPEVLQKTSLPIVSDDDCRSVYGVPDIEDQMICAGGEAGKGGCQGDDGGPLACMDGDGNIYLGGIASWAYGCGEEGYPGVFAEVAYFVDWISKNAN